MKKLFLLLVTLIAFTNICYASFPIQSNLVTYTDTLQTDKIKEYHTSLIKLGIDLNDCKCENCRNGIVPLVINSNSNDTIQQSSAIGLYILSGLILLGVIIWLSIGLTRAYNCVDTGDCPQSSGEKPNSGAPIELLWMSLLLLISAGVAIKARFIQIRNKRNILKNI